MMTDVVDVRAQRLEIAERIDGDAFHDEFLFVSVCSKTRQKRTAMARADAATRELADVRRQWDRARQASEAARAGRIQAAQNGAGATPSKPDVTLAKHFTESRVARSTRSK